MNLFFFIRQVTMRDNFIPTIVNFNTDDISDEVRIQMKKKYLDNPDYDYEKARLINSVKRNQINRMIRIHDLQANRASHACGPLVKWALAQFQYADMLKRVEPLRNELRDLEVYSIHTR